MTCPKCGEGTIITIRFKHNEKMAYLCDFCESLWFEDESIDLTTGHALRSFSGDEQEYTIEELNQEDQDHQPIIRSYEERR